MICMVINGIFVSRGARCQAHEWWYSCKSWDISWSRSALPPSRLEMSGLAPNFRTNSARLKYFFSKASVKAVPCMDCLCAWGRYCPLWGYLLVHENLHGWHSEYVFLIQQKRRRQDCNQLVNLAVDCESGVAFASVPDTLLSHFCRLTGIGTV